ncbi:MAG: twin-arginine translocase TatA/TatE family subunit [Deltaproteobacteria bacterium]|nr:twin-arginine translocase TatA/TatE family subunit [Deltaproteobacteria bacterium]
MFGIGFTEILVIVLAALLIFGPEKLPELAKYLGRGMRELRRVNNDLHNSFQEAMYAEESKAAKESPYLNNDDSNQPKEKQLPAPIDSNSKQSSSEVLNKNNNIDSNNAQKGQGSN